MLGLADRVGAEMKDRSGQHGTGMALAHAFDKVIERTDTAGSDHRRTHRIGYSAGQRNVVSGLGAIAVHRGQQDLAGTEIHHLSRELHRIDAGRCAPAMGEYLPAQRFAFARDLLGVYRHDNALIAELVGSAGHEFRVLHGRRVDRNLVGPGEQKPANVRNLAHATAHRQRHEALLGGARHHVEDRFAVVAGGGDVKEAEFVRAGGIIGLGRFHRIAGIDQIDEINTFDDAAVLHIETGNDAGFEGHAKSAFLRARITAIIVATVQTINAAMPKGRLISISQPITNIV